MAEKLYGNRSLSELTPYFGAHMLAMTAEELDRKGDIAAELAYRDKRIAKLESELDRLTVATTVQRCNGCADEHWVRPRDMAEGKCAKWWRDAFMKENE